MKVARACLHFCLSDVMDYSVLNNSELDQVCLTRRKGKAALCSRLAQAKSDRFFWSHLPPLSPPLCLWPLAVCLNFLGPFHNISCSSVGFAWQPGLFHSLHICLSLYCLVDRDRTALADLPDLDWCVEVCLHSVCCLHSRTDFSGHRIQSEGCACVPAFLPVRRNGLVCVERRMFKEVVHVLVQLGFSISVSNRRFSVDHLVHSLC